MSVEPPYGGPASGTDLYGKNVAKVEQPDQVTNPDGCVATETLAAAQHGRQGGVGHQ